MSKPKFFERTSLFAPTYIEHKVGEETLRFYPLSVNMLWKMQSAVEPIAQALRLLSAGKNDCEQTIDQGVDEETGERRVVTHIGAVKPEIAAMRETRMDDQIKKAMDTFFSNEMRAFVGELITDSLRDDFTRAEARNSGTTTLMMEGSDEQPGLDLTTLAGMIMGIVKSNQGVFGPFAQKIKDAVSARVGTALDEVTGPGQPAAPDFDDSTRSEISEELENEKPPATSVPSPATID